MGIFSPPDEKIRIAFIFSLSLNVGMEHNFQKYTGGQVRRLPANRGFYDYDVSLKKKVEKWVPAIYLRSRCQKKVTTLTHTFLTATLLFSKLAHCLVR